MSDIEIEKVRYRYKQITKRVNLEFRNSESEVSNSLYVGSYGRGTSVSLSDIDMVVILPDSEYYKYDSYIYNGQSSLLQKLKEILQKTYSTSHVRADRQVVQIAFDDKIKFEIVPVFNADDEISFIFPDTNHCGSWELTNPKKEIEEEKKKITKIAI